MKRYVTLASALLMGSVIGIQNPRTLTSATVAEGKACKNKHQTTATKNGGLQGTRGNNVLRTSNVRRRVTKARKSSCASVKRESKSSEKVLNWGPASCSDYEKKSKSKKSRCHKKSKSSKSSGKVGTNPSCSGKSKSPRKSCKSHKKSRSSGKVGTNPSSSGKSESSCSSGHIKLNRDRLGQGKRRFPLRRGPRRSPSQGHCSTLTPGTSPSSS
jgi:hypothetical protein